MSKIELNPINGRKSFYGKAVVEESNGVSKLFSYGTHVATYYHKSNRMVVNRWYSITTSSHINSFLDYYGFDTCTKKEMEAYYEDTH